MLLILFLEEKGETQNNDFSCLRAASEIVDRIQTQAFALLSLILLPF